MENKPEEITEVLTTGDLPSIYSDYPVRQLTESQFHSISQTKTPQGIAAVIRLPSEIYSADLPADTGKRVLLLEDIQDPGNAGTLIRTAAAFDFSGIIMTENCADPLAPKTVQATAGAVLSLWIRRTNNYLELAATLKKDGHSIIAADLDGNAPPDILREQEKLVLALGNEAAGLSQAILKMADYRIKIPVAGKKAESLNVAACGAICMYMSSNR
jgi:TrmH family RNA methyltransferase